jgi:hypothetical protein
LKGERLSVGKSISVQDHGRILIPEHKNAQGTESIFIVGDLTLFRLMAFCNLAHGIRDKILSGNASLPRADDKKV